MSSFIQEKPSFGWLYGNTSMDDESLLDRWILELHLYLIGERSGARVSHVIKTGLVERPLSGDEEKYNRFLALGVLAAQDKELYHISSQCYQRLTGRRLSNAALAVNHPAVREHIWRYKVPSGVDTWKRWAWANLKLRFQAFVESIVPRY